MLKFEKHKMHKEEEKCSKIRENVVVFIKKNDYVIYEWSPSHLHVTFIKMDYDWGPNPRLPPPPNRSHSVPVWYLINSKPSCGACKTGVSPVIIF